MKKELVISIDPKLDKIKAIITELVESVILDEKD